MNISNIIDIFSVLFCLIIIFVFMSLVYLMIVGPDLKNTDLNIMSDNQSPKDIYELDKEIHKHDKDN